MTTPLHFQAEEENSSGDGCCCMPYLHSALLRIRNTFQHVVSGLQCWPCAENGAGVFSSEDLPVSVEETSPSLYGSSSSYGTFNLNTSKEELGRAYSSSLTLYQPVYSKPNDPRIVIFTRSVNPDAVDATLYGYVWALWSVICRCAAWAWTKLSNSFMRGGDDVNLSVEETEPARLQSLVRPFFSDYDA